MNKIRVDKILARVLYLVFCVAFIIFVVSACAKSTDIYDALNISDIQRFIETEQNIANEIAAIPEPTDISDDENDENKDGDSETTESFAEITVEEIEPNDENIIENIEEDNIINIDYEDNIDTVDIIDIIDEEITVVEENIVDIQGEFTEILISAIGDCSLASNYVKPYANSFYNYYDLHGASYFFENVFSVLSGDDITVANLECALTDSGTRANKRYCYRGNKDYSSILVEGSIEIVNLENNHTFDYSEEGYNDTIESLEEAGIDYFGNGVILIKEVKGVKIGFIGFMGSSDVSNYRLERLKNALLYLDENGADIKIVSFHWGNVDEKIANENQRILAHFAVDNGADLILGHHPHVLQGIEQYKGKYIVYSLGNFIFDGNVISDEDHRTSIIFQQKFILQENVIVNSSINIIPVYTTSNLYVNNFQPMIVDGDRKDRILKKVDDRSPD